MRKIAVLFLILFAPVAMAQTAMDNPQSFTPIEVTQDSGTFTLTGGTPPISVYRDVNGNWEPVLTGWFPASMTAYTFSMTNLNPSTTYNLSLVGGTNSASEGALRSFTTQAVPAGPYLDVPENHWAVTQIQWMKDNNITSGCGNGNYCPNNTVTRAEMAVFMYNLAQLLQQ